MPSASKCNGLLSVMASKRERFLICSTDVRLGALSLKVKCSLSLYKISGLIVAEEMISGGFSDRVEHRKKGWTHQTVYSGLSF